MEYRLHEESQKYVTLVVSKSYLNLEDIEWLERKTNCEFVSASTAGGGHVKVMLKK